MERTIEIELDGAKHSVYAGNAALRRYRMAGGSMKALEGVETTGENSLDDMMDIVDSLALLIHANLVAPDGLTVDDMVNAMPSMQDLITASEELFSGVPWLKNGAAAGSEPK